MKLCMYEPCNYETFLCITLFNICTTLFSIPCLREGTSITISFHQDSSWLRKLRKGHKLEGHKNCVTNRRTDTPNYRFVAFDNKPMNISILVFHHVFLSNFFHRPTKYLRLNKPLENRTWINILQPLSGKERIAWVSLPFMEVDMCWRRFSILNKQ